MNKYGARKVEIDGHRFASRAEGNRYLIHRDRLKHGIISDLELHPHFDYVVNGVKIGRGYTADFAYTVAADGSRCVEDVKGRPARDWPLRRDLFLALYPDRVLLEVRNGISKKIKPGH